MVPMSDLVRTERPPVEKLALAIIVFNNRLFAVSHERDAKLEGQLPRLFKSTPSVT